jgi:hypothetical protein
MLNASLRIFNDIKNDTTTGVDRYSEFPHGIIKINNLRIPCIPPRSGAVAVEGGDQTLCPGRSIVKYVDWLISFVKYVIHQDGGAKNQWAAVGVV